MSAQTGSATADEGIDNLPLLGADAAQFVAVITEYVRHVCRRTVSLGGGASGHGEEKPISANVQLVQRVWHIVQRAVGNVKVMDGRTQTSVAHHELDLSNIDS